MKFEFNWPRVSEKTVLNIDETPIWGALAERSTLTYGSYKWLPYIFYACSESKKSHTFLCDIKHSSDALSINILISLKPLVTAVI